VFILNTFRQLARARGTISIDCWITTL